MCWAMLASMGATAAGGAIASNEAEASAVREAKARNDELRRLREKSRAASSANQTALSDALGKMGSETLGQAQETRTNAITSNIDSATAGGDVPLSENAPNIVQAEYAKQAQKATDNAKTSAGRLGRLGGFGQQQFGVGMQTNDAAQQIAANNQPVQSWAQLLPHLQDYRAIESYKPSSGLGRLLQAAGMAFGRASGAKAGGSTGSGYSDPWAGMRG
jgi:hypothetical protein